MINAEIIAIGSELLTPTRLDTNSPWFTEKLNDIGIDVKSKMIVGDDESRLAGAVADAVRRSQVVITTGGLGPTEDDVTRTAAAKAVGRELEYRDDLEAHLRERFKAWGREMPEINKRQAYIIKGSEIIPNANGSAAGMLLIDGERVLAVLPGPPRENQPMFLGSVLPRLAELAGESFVSRRVLKVVGLGESAVDEIAAPIYGAHPDVETSILFNKSEVELHLSAKGADKAATRAIVDGLADELANALGRHVFSTDGETMEAVVGRLLVSRNETVSFAESCTGGLIAERITNIPGSSRYFLESAVTYSNEAKERALGVAHELLEKFGAVSSECAEAMAAGIRERSGSDHAISVTGIAGPDGGSEEKPVGTVFIGYAGNGGTKSKRIGLPGDRELIRWRTSQAALEYLRRRLIS